MNRGQRVVLSATCAAIAAALFLSAGPYSIRDGVYKDRKSGYASFFEPGERTETNSWNPLSRPSKSRADQPSPILGLGVPLALIGAGLFVLMGSRRP